MIKLSCPSCNGELQLPDNLGVAHCMYCGAKILLHQSDATNEKTNIERYFEIAQVALESKNYDEAILYSNKVLEIDPRNVQSWISKAIATFWLTTGAHNRYNEAVGYLNRSAQISPNNEQIINARHELANLQSWWLNNLGNDAFKHAVEMYKIKSGSLSVAEEIIQQSKELFVKAMNYYLEAAIYAPNDEVVLQNIALCAKKAWWIPWSDTVSAHTQRLEFLLSKKHAEASLPKLKLQIQAESSNLLTLRKSKGFFNNLKSKEAEKKIEKLQDEIARLEKAASYIPPPPEL